MGKVNSHNTKKIWEKSKLSKVLVSEIFWVKQKSIPFPKYGKSEFPLYGKNRRKHKHFKVKGFWNFLLEAEIHAVPKTWEKWIAIIREKYGKTETF